MKLVSFSNKRPVVAEQGSFLTVSPTEGKLRITSTVAKTMGVVAGDYVAIGGDPESGQFFIYKGVKDDKVQVGNKLAEAGQSLEFGSKNVWDELGGSTEHGLKYTVAETPVEYEGMSLFELTDKETVAKQVRAKKEEDAPVGEVIKADAPVETETTDEGFTLD